MSDEQVQGFGEYHPEAAAYGPYNDAMAAWRNQVRAMQDEGGLPGPQEAAEPPVERQEDQEAEQRPTTLQGDDATGLREVPTPVPDPAPQGVSDDPREVYDPAEHNAPDVMEHLKTVGADEAERIFASEAAGRNRKGIMALRPQADQASGSA